MSDNDIVRVVIESRDTDMFGILYDRYIKMVYNRCFSFVRNSQEAEDLTHDIFLKAFIKLKTYNAESKFSTWLYSLTINYCIDFTRKRTIKTSDIDFSQLMDYVNPDTIEETFYNIKSDQIIQILDFINPEEKMLLLLKYQDELSVKEISTLLNIGESAVKMRLSRSREKVVFIFKTKFEAKK